jgi:hypothetical protein
MVLQFRARRLSHALRRAAGGTTEDPHDPVLAAACDAVLLARLRVGYRQAAEQMEPDVPEDLLSSLPAALRSITAGLRGLTAQTRTLPSARLESASPWAEGGCSGARRPAGA